MKDNGDFDEAYFTGHLPENHGAQCNSISLLAVEFNKISIKMQCFICKTREKQKPRDRRGFWG